MKVFFKFLQLVVVNFFEGPLNWALNFITLASLFVSMQSHTFPSWIAWITLAVNAFLVSFLVWRKENRRANDLGSDLRKIQNSIPNYDVVIGNPRRYTVRMILEKVSKEIKNLEQSMAKDKQISELSGMAKLSQMAKNIGNLGFATVSHEEQLKDLKEFYEALSKYDNKLKGLYQLDVSIKSTRYDKNIEIIMTSDDTNNMIIEDDYEKDQLPQKRQRLSYPFLFRAPSLDAPTQFANKYYISCIAENNQASSELEYINASRPVDVFYSSFYVFAKKDSVRFKVTVHSTKLLKPQVIEKEIDLTSAQTIPVLDVDL